MTPLLRKLGLKPGKRACFLHAPPHYADLLGPLPDGVLVLDTPAPPMDFIHYFTPHHPALAHDFPHLKATLAFDGMLWVSWPKKTSALPSDLDANIVRAIGLSGGLVDVKVCAVDADWSALKFVYRLKDRR